MSIYFLFCSILPCAFKIILKESPFPRHWRLAILCFQRRILRWHNPMLTLIGSCNLLFHLRLLCPIWATGILTIRNARSFAEGCPSKTKISPKGVEKVEEVATVTTAISPPLPKEHPRVSTVHALHSLAVPYRLPACLSWWRSNAPNRLVNILMCGGFPHLKLPSFVVGAQVIHNLDELEYAKEVIAEYLDIGAVSPCKATELRFLVPWFVLSKLEPNGDVKCHFTRN